MRNISTIYGNDRATGMAGRARKDQKTNTHNIPTHLYHVPSVFFLPEGNTREAVSGRMLFSPASAKIEPITERTLVFCFQSRWHPVGVEWLLLLLWSWCHFYIESLLLQHPHCLSAGRRNVDRPGLFAKSALPYAQQELSTTSAGERGKEKKDSSHAVYGWMVFLCVCQSMREFLYRAALSFRLGRSCIYCFDFLSRHFLVSITDRFWPHPELIWTLVVNNDGGSYTSS